MNDTPNELQSDELRYHEFNRDVEDFCEDSARLFDELMQRVHVLRSQPPSEARDAELLLVLKQMQQIISSVKGVQAT